MRRLILPALAAIACASAAHADDPKPRPVFTEDGTVKVPAFELPPSAFLSPEALAQQKARARMGLPIMDSSRGEMSAVEARKALARYLQPQVDRYLKMFAVDVSETTIAGVPARIVAPKGGKADPKRVLINLHGGAFSTCWESCSLIESVPIAGTGNFRVISVNYRMGPEARHPAGLEDVEKVYRDLLKRYKPSQIGVFGCSAGGALTAQLGAWLPKRGLPQPAALGIFGAGGLRFGAGDSAWIASAIDGSFAGPAKPGEKAIDMTKGYFDGADMGDDVLSPALHPAVIAKFPPSLVITGTRAMDMTPAIFTNSKLLEAGVRSTLIVGEGMGHCYIYSEDLPEAKAAWQVIVRHFRENLK
ncbi:alpha/beta hydrolase [Novosphingobium sp. TH158]|uniref:alpha/beta hydrolase n=1 Tax=Novosphingobium sp. TH158 TaxID=2067455 RepID=UPI000C7AE829|nr:alpha/beta hydrolase [Novosphingobium sp. TH158]PLK24248.1 alpha/beta hydrolase [Novosphingobium sp. TH158]